ncbi:hypothetical protein E4T38_07516 [Aureobasidium subglaciale]|nr:hypothetical protein E4T38_07516 [Aureobasidium subglaciale]KAI5217201.1 hypothetical protein E4T40_07571 [Aureobasidium subglaciale]KAI5220479.1 hypothetical protein E4T41_07442 [Aureobasidium subglaciale]KAI5258314.1 hypothetical protein E4T46_07419 [Aureobasidium subglaciale]
MSALMPAIQEDVTFAPALDEAQYAFETAVPYNERNMAAPTRPEQGHSRHQSSDVRRVAMPRRSTRGPLDMDTTSGHSARLDFDNIYSAASTTEPPPSATRTASPAPTAMPIRTASPASSLLSPTQHTNPSIRTRSKSPGSRTMQLDLSPLLRPSLYAPVPTSQVATPFLSSSHQPVPDTDLETLLSHRRFLHAAEKATDLLTSGSISPSDTQKVLELLYARFSCLVLCNLSPLAAKEAKPLSDLLARESAAYTRPFREAFLAQIPWHLRLLLLHLQVTGQVDGHRKCIMGLYALGADCRSLSQKARLEKNETKVKAWEQRLQDLGIRVAAELVEMGELETAKRHLDTISLDTADEMERRRMCTRQTLLLLKIGDTEAAKTCLSAFPSATTLDENAQLDKGILETLTSLSSSMYPAAVTQLQDLASSSYPPSSALVKHNLAIAHLYTNNVNIAANMLETLVQEEGTVFPALLFNLSTMYELKTEKAREKKLGLVDTVAGLDDGQGRSSAQTGGFEKGLGEFKL